ncbi:MAG: hypothetical protein KF806_05870 [Nitrospira sp.]|nr:hypothetical protein [Nitrospira sp.]
MNGLAYATFGFCLALLYMIYNELFKILAVLKEIRKELFMRLGPTSSVYNEQYKETNLHHMVADIHRVITK